MHVKVLEKKAQKKYKYCYFPKTSSERQMPFRMVKYQK